MDHMCRMILPAVMMLLVAACGGGGESASSSGSAVSTVQARGTVNGGEIGGTGLTVVSALQDSPSSISGEAYSTTISAAGPQLLLIQDENEAVRGLTFSVKDDLLLPTLPRNLRADATSTALALLLLSPGVTPSDWSLAQPIAAALQTLKSFSGFVAFLRSNLPTKTLAEAIADPAYEPLLLACLEEWPAKAATVAPLASIATTSAAFAVPPKVSPVLGAPALGTGGIRAEIEKGYTGRHDITATLTNYSLRSVALYEYSDSTGSGTPVLSPNHPVWFQGGDGLTSLSLFGGAQQIAPRSMSRPLLFSNPNGKVYYYAVGPGFAPYPASLRSEVTVTWEDLAKPVLYDFIKYALAPALSFWSGYPVSDLMDTAFMLEGLRKGQDAEFIALGQQIVRMGVENAGAAGSVIAYRVILKELMQVTLGKAEPFIKGGFRGFFKSVFRIGAFFDSLNFVLYVNELINLPARAKIEVSAPYDTVEFSAATYLAKKTDRQINIGLIRSDGSADVLVVQYTITPSTAVKDQDYSDASPSPGFVRFEAGQKTASIPLWILDNPANTGARFATLTLGPITGLGKIGAQSALSLTIGSPTVLNVCQPDVPTFAPSGCEWPRIVAKNPFTPLQAGQAVPISDLFEYRPGTCSQITLMLFALPLRSSEYSFEGLQDPSLYEHHNLVPFSFLLGPDLPALEPSSVRLRPNTSIERSIGVGKIVFQYRRDDPLGQFPAVYHGNFQCIFSLRSSQ